MDRRAIPDDDHPARYLAQQVLEKLNHRVRVDGVVLTVEVEFALGRDGADGREMVASAPLPHDGGLTHRCIGADDTG